MSRTLGVGGLDCNDARVGKRTLSWILALGGSAWSGLREVAKVGHGKYFRRISSLMVRYIPAK